MNAIHRLISSAGQKTHEKFYGAVFVWNGHAYPCTHGDIVRNPQLIVGGFSPDTEVIITVRDDQFGDPSGPRPQKGNPCFLQPDPDNDTVFALYVTTVMTSVGDTILKMLCHDANQGA